MQSGFQDSDILSYLALPQDYNPLPSVDPIEFLKRHLHELPPNIIQRFSLVTTPKQRTTITEIRNRRLKFTESRPRSLSFAVARNTWPTLWQGRERRGQEEGKEEQEWAKMNFLGGSEQQVGNLAKLLGDMEEEREAERVRFIQRTQANDDFVPEEESDSEDENDSEYPEIQEPESPQEAQALFERIIRERFIYGLLEGADYDSVDWDEWLDVDDDRNAEERWFDDD
ncbi:uncharacterized protein F5891DRAFT_999846 [Suillus fuscotomentosus]|uniref:CCD97-like C-terminal domain-containing protein n=1 Tax=Suillus fuscotomentosus TaxID=1912939 RepID=A0AAD4EIY1_9AGAM|nr:uncharacterized protein F5891DRAFT_999846 [Suillus fuscotomentosus]KAG1907027.1 hypothetical protein F5891DRAFT_999846 [Suillus fuscotomentosus]